MKNSSSSIEQQDFYYSKSRLKTYIERLKSVPNGDRAIEFLNYLQASGMSTIRVVRYSQCLVKMLPVLDIQTAGRKEVEAYIAGINGRSDYRAWTKHAYKLTAKKLFQYLRHGNIDRDTPFPPEVAWIKLRISEAELQKDARATPDKLLSSDDVTALLKATTNPRDEAMLLVLFEGAFRPSELLSMRVGAVQFLNEYCVVSTKGKTGTKRIPLILSFKPLMRWLSAHPRRNEAEAPLWCALATNHLGDQLTYRHFRDIVVRTAARSGLHKEVWPYLFRHSQLTNMADKLTDSKLTLFAGWTLGTKMVRRYVHWSGRDLDQSLLAIHGMAPAEASNHALQLVACPRCEARNPPSSPRCERCGFILDKKLAIEAEDDLEARVGKLEDLVRGALGGAGGAPPAPGQPRA